MMGGYVNLDGSNVGNSSMNGSSELSLAQGKNYDSIHSNQHGGQNMLPTNSRMNTSMSEMNSSMPPMNSSMSSMSSMSGMNSSMPQMNSSMSGMNSTMPQMNSSMNKLMLGGQAPVGDQGLLDASLRGAGHLGPLDRSFSEIAGMKDQAGGRRRRKQRSSKRKGRSSKRGRRSTKRGRRSTRRRRSMRGGEAPVNSPDMLLNGSQAQDAVNGMNPEWKLVEDASAFNPRS